MGPVDSWISGGRERERERERETERQRERERAGRQGHGQIARSVLVGRQAMAERRTRAFLVSSLDGKPGVPCPDRCPVNLTLFRQYKTR